MRDYALRGTTNHDIKRLFPRIVPCRLKNSSPPFTVHPPAEFRENFSRSLANAKKLPSGHTGNSGLTVARFRTGQISDFGSYLHGHPRATLALRHETNGRSDCGGTAALRWKAV